MRYILFCLMVIFCANAQAESSAPAASANAPAAVPVIQEKANFAAERMVVPQARVKDIIDGITVVLENGRGETVTVRLADIWVPWESPDSPGETMTEAKIQLTKQFKGRIVRLYQPKVSDPKTLVSPLGQSLAMMERDDGVWAQGILVSLGLANVMPHPAFADMTVQLNKLEAAARTNKLGLWGSPKWKVLDAATEATFAKGQYRVVQGTVDTTFSKNNRIYITFAQDLTKSLTIVVNAQDRLKFSHANINLLGLNKKRIEARGFVQDINGPVLIVTDPAYLQILAD